LGDTDVPSARFADDPAARRLFDLRGVANERAASVQLT